MVRFRSPAWLRCCAAAPVPVGAYREEGAVCAEYASGPVTS